MADEEVDFEEAVDLGDAPMEESAGSGKKGRDATGRRLAIRTLCLPWLHILLQRCVPNHVHTRRVVTAAFHGVVSASNPHPPPSTLTLSLTQVEGAGCARLGDDDGGGRQV